MTPRFQQPGNVRNRREQRQKPGAQLRPCATLGSFSLMRALVLGAVGLAVVVAVLGGLLITRSDKPPELMRGPFFCFPHDLTPLCYSDFDECRSKALKLGAKPTCAMQPRAACFSATSPDETRGAMCSASMTQCEALLKSSALQFKTTGSCKVYSATTEALKAARIAEGRRRRRRRAAAPDATVEARWYCLEASKNHSGVCARTQALCDRIANSSSGRRRCVPTNTAWCLQLSERGSKTELCFPTVNDCRGSRRTYLAVNRRASRCRARR